MIEGRCCGLAGALFGHRFRPRYTHLPPAWAVKAKGSPEFLLRVVEAASERVYEGEVCTRCGLLRRPGSLLAEGGPRP